MLDKMPQQNATKFAIFLEYENQRSLVYVDIDQESGHSLGKNIKYRTK